MSRTSHDRTPQLDDHPDLADLQSYDFPSESLKRTDVALIAKAWIGEDLACFFADAETSLRFVVLFMAYNAYMPALGGDDMRAAPIAARYEVDVFVCENHVPIVDRAERVSRRKA